MMKGIKDYLTDTSKAPESTAGKSEANEPTTNPEISQGPRPKKKRGRRRKLTDPDVKTVAELLSNNLSLVSPPCKTNKILKEVPVSPTKTLPNSCDVSKLNSPNNNTAVDNQAKDLTAKPKRSLLKPPELNFSPINTTEGISEKRNAFQFLMNSRNNVIGRNLDGKESENISTPKDKSPTLEKRKNLLQKWAEQKGGGKRKREEVQVEKCIKVKLEKRAKRLKKMLQGEGEGQEEEQNKAPKKRGRKPKNKLNRRKLSTSESENSNLGPSEGPSLADVLSEEVVEEVCYSEISTVVSKDNITEEPEDVALVLSSEQESNNSPSPKKNGNLLSFLGIFNKKPEKSNDDSDCSENSIKVYKESFTNTRLKKEVIKIKMFTPNNKVKVHPKKSNSITKKKESKPDSNDDPLNDSLEDFSSPKKKHKKIKTKVEAVPKSVRDPDSLFSDSSNSIIEPKSQPEEPPALPESTESNKKSLRKRNPINYNYNFGLEEAPKAKKLKAKRKLESDTESVELLSSEDDSNSTPVAQKPKTNVKIAPVFFKLTPKPKVDPEVLEARRQFLLSSIPDSMKKVIEKQKSEIKDFDVFPTISHVQQKCESKFWNLPKPELSYCSSADYVPPKSLKCQDLLSKAEPCDRKFATEVEKVKHLKSVLQRIKAQNPDYPVYKVFRQIYEKSGKQFVQSEDKSKRKKRSKNAKKNQEHAQDIKASKDTEMWTEKYKPARSEDILGNYRGVKKLKEWLETWKNYSEEINARKRNKGTNSNSESEFESTDCDSRDSTRLPDNTIVLHGPSGSGKTSAVYAIANELGLNVLELNASTKRSGKKILQELHEATQSHQVRKSDSLAKFMTKEEPAKSKKMCILLLEDIDIIFEQDDGFLSSLAQLLITSKRPIILTTTDVTPPHVQKFMFQCDCIDFLPLSVQCLAIWLQIVCLVEGILSDKDDLASLLEYNKGDIRKTLLEVQFWCQSGGQLEKDKKCIFKTVSKQSSVVKVADDELNFEMSEDEAATDQFVHKHALSSFEVVHPSDIPERFDLGLLWWNMPDLLGVPSSSDSRLFNKRNSEEMLDKTLTNESDLKLVSRIYDSLALTDVLFKHKPDKYCSKEPVIHTWTSEVLNSLELTGRTEDRVLSDVSQDLCHSLVNGSLESYRRIEVKGGQMNMAVPDVEERKWRSNQHSAEDFLKEALPLSNILDRGSVAMDFLPVLRDIGRFEEKRAATNTKRGNRFRHYLKDLNINFEPELCKLACDQLNVLEK